MATDEELREAFVAGFMESAEGVNGEYVRSGTPRDVANAKADRYLCDHDWTDADPEEARHGRAKRECTECGETDYIDWPV